ncbi:MAG: hypothetical protein JO256_00910 [Alphaproteobacteria bacterium]|nr:hypothetical protein [Alphaproteobacteria bacterium]
MTKFRFVLVLLCIGLLGVIPIISGLPKPAAAIGVQQASSIRTEFLISLREAVSLMDHDQFNEALKLVDGLSAAPGKTNAETKLLNQVREQTLAQRQLAPERARERQMELVFYQATDLENAGKYKDALALIDGLKDIPDNPLGRDIIQMRTFLMRLRKAHLDSQVR